MVTYPRESLAGWIDVTRFANARAWARLRGTARLAIDYRIAAEVFLRLREEIVLLGIAEPLPPQEGRASHPLDGRLKAEPGGLDKALLDFGLSPHPALVVAVEGPTETYILPKVLAYTGIAEQSGWIEVVDMQGGNSDAKALARHVVHPRLGDERGDYAMLRRPLTALAIVVDPDTKYNKTEARDLIVTKAFEALPPLRRTDKMRKLLDDLISVHTWEPELGPFEFAHFTDGELTRAILSAAPSGLRTNEATLRAEISAERSSGRWNLKVVLERNSPGLSKPVLAERLWPVLELRIQEALANGDERAHPPISRISRTLYGISFFARRANAVEL